MHKITLDEAIALNNNAKNHYQQSMDSGDDSKTYVPPFKVYPTSISSKFNKERIYTHTMGVKTSLQHHALLKELLTCLFHKSIYWSVHIQFSLSSISILIGLKNYQKLFLNNNKYLSTITTIFIAGLNQYILDLEIHITNENNPNKHLPIQQII